MHKDVNGNELFRCTVLEGMFLQTLLAVTLQAPDLAEIGKAENLNSFRAQDLE